MAFDRLIRFVDQAGTTQYGNVEHELGDDTLEGKEVQLVSGNIESGFELLPERSIILSPVETSPLVLCAGVNYRSHSRETKFSPPTKPVIFATPPDRLAGPFEDIPIPPDAQSLLDYEGELIMIIGKDAKDITEDDALDYVLGYSVGNDVSARYYNNPDVSGWQMGYAKSFDKFGPIGPCIVSPKLIPDPQKLHLTTMVNQDKRQDTNTSEMIWTCKQLIAFCSNGRTLRRGTIIMTGTPEGVGWHSEGCLKNGDVVKVAIEGIGSIRNKMRFF